MCSLEEAFQMFSDSASRNDYFGSDDPDKKKKKKRRMPPAEAVIEPDRPAHRALPPAELLGGGVTANTASTSMSDMLNATDRAEYFPNPSVDNKDKNVYTLEPDWATAFNDTSAPEWIKQRMPSRSAEVPLVPSPWLDGASTLWQNIPDSQKTQFNLEGAEAAAKSGLDALQRKFDKMFKKLEDLETSRAESQHLEIILFVLGGIFLLLLLDILVKQGTKAMMILGSAAGSAAGSVRAL